MVISNLKGGLGNYLFQIASGYSLSLKNNDVFAIDKTKIMQVHSNWNNYISNIFRKINISNNINNYNYYLYDCLKYKEIPYVPNILIDGYFQSEKYWQNYEEKIKELFEIDKNTLNYLIEKYQDKINIDNVCSIHIRRGDYLNIDFFNKLDINNYYNKAMDIIGYDKYFLVFSDDIQWCKSQFKNTNLSFIEEKSDYLELYLMSLCKHNIISNSTFSWWGAYLNKNFDKKVIAPKIWFTHTHSNDDIVPVNWIKI